MVPNLQKRAQNNEGLKKTDAYRQNGHTMIMVTMNVMMVMVKMRAGPT